MKRSIQTVLTICLLVCATSLSHAQMGGNPRFSNLQIHVQVHYASGAAAGRGIQVTIEREGGGIVAQTETDTQGKVSVNVIGATFYTVRVNEPGFQSPPPQRVDLNTASSAYVMFELKPERAQGAPKVPPEGPAAQINASQVPENALKEFKKGEDLLLKEQKSEESIGHFKKAIELHDGFTQAYVLLGIAYLDLRKPTDAQSVLEKALKLDANSAAAHLELGASFNQQKKYPDAERELKRGLELNPDAAEGQYEIAKTYWAVGNFAEADAYATKAAKVRPDLAAVHVLLGNLALKKNDPNTAVNEFNEYLRLDPKGAMAEAVRDMVKKIEKKTASK